MSQPERWLIHNEREIAKAERFLDLIGRIELTWLEAALLLHHYYRGLHLGDVAGIVGHHIKEVEAARYALVAKAAVVLGYVTAEQAGVTVRVVEEPPDPRWEQVTELWQHGHSGPVIAKRLGVTPNTIYRWMKIYGPVERKEPPEWEKIRMLRQQGLSHRAIAERLGVTRHTVRRALGAEKAKP